MKYKLKTPSIIRLLAIFSITLSFFLQIEGLKSEVIESSKDPSLSFQKKSCEVEKIDYEIIIYCKLKVLFRHSSHYPSEKELYLKEEEVEGMAYGDFVEQTISPLSGKPNLYHNPFPLPVKLQNLTDQVMTIIDLKKPHQDGSLRWVIPTTIQNSKGELIEEVSVIQEFIIENGVLTLKKGRLNLIQVDLKKVSHPINNLP
ncbi:MAG: hypothetical protein CME68_04285 [Halobacteriovoraceae bacterium]|nr:hypothetical protein [Halobacteriovoraceae bacterium]